MRDNVNILLTCGETSGEYHAGLLVKELKELDPGCRVIALGSSGLVGAGADVSFPMERYAFMGFSEILRGLPKIFSLERELKSLLRSGDIDLFIPVDYPGLNLRLARFAKSQGIPVMYFISPQVWAWGSRRLAKMRSNIDLMVVILPFEEEIYREEGIPVFYAGHPVVDEIEAPPGVKSPPLEKEKFSILIFPGSRVQEVRRILPPMLDGAGRILKKFPEAEFILGLAPMIDEKVIDIPVELEPHLRISRTGLKELKKVSLVLAASGTVTLQTAVSGTPMITMYRTSLFTYLIGRMLVKIPYVAMPNVLAGRKIIPELLQNEVSGARIADEAESILADEYRYRSISAALLELREKLKGGGGLRDAAARALRLAGKDPDV